MSVNVGECQGDVVALHLGVRCNSIVEYQLIVCEVIGLIPHGGPIELFFVPTCVPQLV